METFVALCVRKKRDSSVAELSLLKCRAGLSKFR